MNELHTLALQAAREIIAAHYESPGSVELENVKVAAEILRLAKLNGELEAVEAHGVAA
ncbi:MAG TPA: hypothetical protein VKX49_10345 [Bryobacteraceae bacterium]|nr:hypothetical protein [Bryobacteraceae bacterium]